MNVEQTCGRAFEEVGLLGMAAASNNKTIIIDLDTREEAGVLGTEQLIQIDAIDKFKDRLHTAYKAAKGHNASLSEKPFDRMLHRVYNNITLHGSRGSGKTTLLNSLIYTLRNPYSDASKRLFTDAEFEGKSPLGHVYVLDVIDPGLVETKEHVLITIISMIKEAVDRHLEKQPFDKNRRAGWDEALNRLSEGLTRLDGIGSRNPHESWEDALYITQKGLQGAQGSIVFETALATFVRLSLNLLNKDLFLIAFDDIDTAIDRGFNVLETVRKYLATPLILVVLAGDLDLYSKIVRLEHWRKFQPSTIPAGESRIYLDKLNELEDQYMMKLLKPSNRIGLLRLDTMFDTQDNSRRYIAEVKYTTEGTQTTQPLSAFINNAIASVYGVGRTDEVSIYRSLILRQPTRTVLQFLKTFSEMRAASNITDWSVVGSIADIALGPLLRNGLSVDLLIDAHPQRLLLLVRDYINRRSLWISGYRLHPDIHDEHGDDTNLVILALAASVMRSIRAHPPVIFDYFIKLCLPHSAHEYVPQDNGSITQYLNFVSGKSSEDSRTEARQNIAVVFWKQAEEGQPWTVSRGVIRVVSKSQQREVKGAFQGRTVDSETSIKNFWLMTDGGITPRQAKPARVRIDYNTIETLAGEKRTKGRAIYRSPIMRNIALLPFAEVFNRQNHSFTLCSILNIIGVMSELSEETSTSLADNLAKLAQFLSFPIPNWGRDIVSARFGNPEQEDGDEGNESGADTTADDGTDDPSLLLLNAFQQWSEYFTKQIRDNNSINIHLLARVWSRFYFTLLRIGDAVRRKDQFLGWLMHRQIVAFLSAVLIEEMHDRSGMSGGERVIPNYDNPTGDDRSFILNIKRVFGSSPHEKIIDSLLDTIRSKNPAQSITPDELESVIAKLEGVYPLFFALFSCPLWACFLYPNTQIARLPEGTELTGASDDLTLLNLQVLHWAKWLPNSERTISVAELLLKGSEIVSVDYSTTATKNFNFPNLYYLLSSIPVASGRNPPAEEPPAEEPSAEEPPAEEPPAEEPSAEEPSAEEPPAEEPPAEEPPAEEPSAEEPSASMDDSKK